MTVRSARLLAAAALGATALSVAPATAAGPCTTVKVGGTTVHACVHEPDEYGTYVCVSAGVDPFEDIQDEAVVGWACVADLGDGPRLYTCFWSARRPILCSR